MKLGNILVGVGLTVLAACTDNTTTARPPRPDEVPSSVSLTGGPLTTGFTIGRSRGEASVSSFSITRYPITVGEYKQCISAGACTAPSRSEGPCAERFRASSTHRVSRVDGNTFGVDDQLPITCTNDSQAEAYCAWQGATFPSADQMVLAARGAAPQRYPWGAEPPNCEQHPGGLDSRFVPCSTSPIDFRVGTHPKGHSPVGMEDVLLTEGELLRSTSDALLSSCRGPAPICIVRGVYPGSIDSLGTSASKGKSAPITSFRCVWSGK